MDYLKKIDEATRFLKDNFINSADILIILGSGLGKLVEKFDIKKKIAYKDIPHFPVSTVPEHKGNLLFTQLGEKNIVFMQGRFHLYEGYDAKDVVFPVRVMQKLGVKFLFVSNAAGGVGEHLSVGDIMLIEDHINLTGANPLIGKNYDELGERFPDMSNAYDKNLRKRIGEIAKEKKIILKKGVYLWLKGPSLETNAEYKMVKILGGDVVGMSTVPEVIAAVHGGMKVAGFSIVTNKFDEKGMEENRSSFKDVVSVANSAGEKLSGLLYEVIKKLDIEE